MLAFVVAGSTRGGQDIPWLRQQPGIPTSVPLDLTNATITGVLFDITRQTSRVIAGTLMVLAPSTDGIFRWTYDAADLVASWYKVQFTATYADGSHVTFSDTWWVEEQLIAA